LYIKVVAACMSIDWVSFSKLELDRAWIKLRDGYVLCARVLAHQSFLILYPTSRARNWHLSKNQSPAALGALTGCLPPRRSFHHRPCPLARRAGAHATAPIPLKSRQQQSSQHDFTNWQILFFLGNAKYLCHATSPKPNRGVCTQ